jgi:hypothetical protein
MFFIYKLFKIIFFYFLKFIFEIIYKNDKISYNKKIIFL